MSISNCSAYCDAATVQPITGIVRPRGETEVPVVEPISAIKPLSKRDDTVEAANNVATLNTDTLAAVLNFAG